jgi:uncharacterized protein YdeI (YjbR/CyaY-like superfamily)
LKRNSETFSLLPTEFATALPRNKKAAVVFVGFSSSGKRNTWTDAKRADTRDKRIAFALQWIGEGKQRNWKYQKC